MNTTLCSVYIYIYFRFLYVYKNLKCMYLLSLSLSLSLIYTHICKPLYTADCFIVFMFTCIFVLVIIHTMYLFIQDMQIQSYTSLDYQLPYPPLELEDFPQINLTETKPVKPEIIDEYMSYDKIRDCMNGTLEEIFSLCSSLDNPVALSLQE